MNDVWLNTAGMGANEMKQIAHIIQALKNPQHFTLHEQLNAKVKEITSQFTLYQS